MTKMAAQKKPQINDKNDDLWEMAASYLDCFSPGCLSRKLPHREQGPLNYLALLSTED